MVSLLGSAWQRWVKCVVGVYSVIKRVFVLFQVYYIPGSGKEALDHVDVDLSMLSLFLQREKTLQKLWCCVANTSDAGDRLQNAAAFAQKKSFMFSKGISRYRSFFPDLLNKVEIISQEAEIRNLSIAPTAPEIGSIKAPTSGAFGSTVAKGLSSQPMSHVPVSTVNRIIFIEPTAAPSKDKASKNRRKEDAQKERVNRFLQGSLGIAMASANPDMMPVLVSDIAWAELRGLSTAISTGCASDVVAFLSSKPAIKRILKLIVLELRHRASIVVDSASISPSTGSASAAIASSGTGISELHLFYALLYSSKDDRFDMISYTYASVSIPTL